MKYLGELISIGVALSWTATALLSEYGSKRMGNLTLNVLRLSIALVLSCVLFWLSTGSPWPANASHEAYGWMLLSGLVGYVIGDYCLFQSYIIIGSRYGQLFMTLAPVAAAITAWAWLGEALRPQALLAMAVTLGGIAMSVLGRGEHKHITLKLPLVGVLFAVGAALCQGVGLVLSKIGMNHYASSVSEPVPAWQLAFFANFFRCVAGVAGFALLLWLRGESGALRSSLRDRRSMVVATATTLCGPFVGVACSLMAVQYTAAGIASTLMALTPILIIVPAWWLFGQKVTLRSVLGAAVSVTGVSMFFLL